MESKGKANFKIIVINKGNFLNYRNYLYFKPEEFERNREKEFIEKVKKDIQKQRNVVYLLLFENGERGGFIAVSASRIYNLNNQEGVPALQVDYLFVNRKYRRKKVIFITEGKKEKISIYLLGLILKLANEKWRYELGLRDLILYPDQQNRKLINFYKELGFFIYKSRKGKKKEIWLIKRVSKKRNML